MFEIGSGTRKLVLLIKNDRKSKYNKLLLGKT